MFTVGAILAGIGALVLIATMNNDNGSQAQEDGTVISLVYGLPGLVMMIGGGSEEIMKELAARQSGV